ALPRDPARERAALDSVRSHRRLARDLQRRPRADVEARRISRWGQQRIGGSGDGGRPGLHQLPQYPGERAHPPGVRLAMMITSSSFVPELEQQGIRFVTHPGPPGPGKNGYRFSGATSSTLSIVSSTQHPKEAWTFLRWLVYEKGLEFAEERGGIPYLIEGLQSGKYR